MTNTDEPSPPRRIDLVPYPTSISEAIERERTELMQIHAMLHCLYEVLLYADDDDSVMHADVANVCARLLSECVTRLDAVRLSSLRIAPDDDDASDPSPPNQVRDARPIYLC
jgi:hypothetical protein